VVLVKAQTKSKSNPFCRVFVPVIFVLLKLIIPVLLAEKCKVIIVITCN